MTQSTNSNIEGFSVWGHRRASSAARKMEVCPSVHGVELARVGIFRWRVFYFMTQSNTSDSGQ